MKPILSVHAQMVFKLLGCHVKVKKNKNFLFFSLKTLTSLKIVPKSASEFLFQFSFVVFVPFLYNTWHCQFSEQIKKSQASSEQFLKSQAAT
jgi:hypothetical protein